MLSYSFKIHSFKKCKDVKRRSTTPAEKSTERYGDNKFSAQPPRLRPSHNRCEDLIKGRVLEKLGNLSSSRVDTYVVQDVVLRRTPFITYFSI